MDEIRQDPRLAFRPPADRWLDVAAAVSLIAAGTALLAATATVLMDRARAAPAHDHHSRLSSPGPPVAWP